MSFLGNEMTSGGLIPRTPSQIRSDLQDSLLSKDPSLTLDDPAYSEIIPSWLDTSVSCIEEIEQIGIDTVNSIDPTLSNEMIADSLGYTLGIIRGESTRANVDVVFTGTNGYNIPKGFLVSNGTYQFYVLNGGVIADGSVTLYCVCTVDGIIPIAENSVTQIITSVPSPYVLTCNNPIAGNQGSGLEPLSQYKARYIQAFNRVSTGTIAYCKELLSAVNFDLKRISILPSNGKTKIIVGGGDPYLIGEAIFKSGLDISTFKQSATESRNFSRFIVDYPDTYKIDFVRPFSRQVSITATYSLLTVSIVPDSSITEAAQPALSNYINNLAIGYNINLLELNEIFKEAIRGIGVDTQFLSNLEFSVSINGISVNPIVGTQLIAQDEEAYFSCNPSAVSVLRI